MNLFTASRAAARFSRGKSCLFAKRVMPQSFCRGWADERANLSSQLGCKIAGATAGVAAGALCIGTTLGATNVRCEETAAADASENAAGFARNPKVRSLKNKLYARLDIAKDGKLSDEEIKQAFKAMDVSGDGTISFEEFSDYLKKSGIRADQMGNYKSVKELFEAFDSDHSGTISQKEFEDHFHGAEYGWRYAASMLRVFLAKGRLIAYTSDVGESFRPILTARLVTAGYALSFAYVGVDVAIETSQAYMDGMTTMLVARTFAFTAAFQLLASMALPSLIIHQTVHFVQHQSHKLPKTPVTRWLPSMVGLCCVPLLPYLDEPVEHGMETVFDYAWPKEEEKEKTH